MDNLLSLQRDFLKSFQGEDSFEKHIKSNKVSSQNRLMVYQNNIREALRKTLAVIYPLTWKLIGEDCANGAAYTFIQQDTFLPKTANLNEWGADFPNFLEQFFPTQNLGYLSDFARLEWLKHLSYCAENATPLSAIDFKGMNIEDYPRLILKLHPSAQIMCSSYALDQVMALIEGTVESIKLGERGSKILITRPDKSINIHWLSEDYYNFLALISKGYSLIEVSHRIPNADLNFQNFLSFFLKNGAFSGYYLASVDEVT